METPKSYSPLDPYLAAVFRGYLARTDMEDSAIANVSDFIVETDFCEAPASTRFHLCCPQGLLTHTLNVVEAILAIIPPDYPKSVPIKVALLHDFCKADFYEETVRNVKIYCSENIPPNVYTKTDQKGCFYWGQKRGYIVKDTFPYGHGEKSVYIAQELGVNLSREEAQAIRYHMGDFFKNPETSQVFATNPLALYLHLADLYASSVLDLNAEGCDKINSFID